MGTHLSSMWEQVSKTAHVAWRNKAMWVLQLQRGQATYGLGTKILPLKKKNPPPQKDIFEGNVHQMYCLLWVAIFESSSDRTALLPWKACLYHYNTCCSGTLLRLAKVYKAWVGAHLSLMWEQVSKTTHVVWRNKVICVLWPQSRQTICGLGTKILPHS